MGFDELGSPFGFNLTTVSEVNMTTGTPQLMIGQMAVAISDVSAIDSD